MATSGRLTRDDWIRIARKALVASGIDDVKVDVLARRLKVTRGSFYWHFKHRQDLLDALLEDWQVNNRREIAEAQARATDGLAFTEIFRIWLGEDPTFPSFDMAIRVWARKSRKVANVVRDIDDAWIATFQGFLERSGITAPESFVRARIIYFHQIGYYALSIHETLDDRIKLAPYYYSALFGEPAPEGFVDALRQLEPRAKRKTGAAGTAAAKPVRKPVRA